MGAHRPDRGAQGRRFRWLRCEGALAPEPRNPVSQAQTARSVHPARHHHMTDHAAEEQFLPGMRQAVKASRAKSAATRKRAEARADAQREEPGGSGPGRPPAGPPRPPLRLLRPRGVGVRRRPGLPGQGPVRRPGRRRVPPRPHRRDRPRRRAAAVAPGGQRGAGAQPGRRGPERPARRALRRHPLRRAAACGPTTARHHREGAVAPRPTPRRGPRGRSAGVGGPRARGSVPRPPQERRVAPGGVVGGARDRLAAAARPRRRGDVLLRARSPRLRAGPARRRPGRATP